MKTTTKCLLVCGALLALVGCRATPEDELLQHVESLPELSTELAATLDTNTMATRRPVLQVPTEEQDTVAALLPCCAIKVRRELMVEYELTKCRSHVAFDLNNLSVLAMARTGGSGPAGKDVRQTKYRSKKLVKPFWCTTSVGPWPAILDDQTGCHSGRWYFLTVFGPDGPIVFSPWQGGEELLPDGMRVVDCQQLFIQRTSCGGIGQCNCTGSACNAPQDCSCPLF